MTDPERVTLTEAAKEALKAAARTYISALHLPRHGPILYIEDVFDPTDIDALARRSLTHLVANILKKEGRYMQFLEFNADSEPEFMSREVTQSLRALNRKNLEHIPITVIHLGSRWDTNEEIENALRGFARESRLETWLADSSGATLDELIDMSESVPVDVRQIE